VPIALIVEDELQLRRLVRTALEAEGLSVEEAATLREGLREASRCRPDLIVCDLGLPDGDGIDLVREVRSWLGTPILILSARTAEDAKIAALDAGADDFVTKPFSVGELMARVRAHLRRGLGGRGAEPQVVRIGNVDVDLALRKVERDGAPVHLTPIEYRLLEVFVANVGRVLTHPRLLREVWGPDHAEMSHHLRVHMNNLRRKLEARPAEPRHFLTETGVGYRLEA
jgi:two-component system KDP operon response regulator KdpE